jgi:uncharacterized protein YdhG (YjbR/CyaY superfamily)
MKKDLDEVKKPEIADGGDKSVIDQYIAGFSIYMQEKLREIRDVIKSSAPDAIEKIAYQMPTFYLHGNLVHFAGYKNHIGLYPTPSGIDSFKEELGCYKNAKGSVQFPIDKPLPLDLIRRIVEYRVEENIRKAADTKRKKQ